MPTDAARAGTVELGDGVAVNRLGYGAMRLTGPGIWGEPADPEGARAVLRRAVELGVDFIDTARSYGPDVSERLIAEALHPYPEGVVIATKSGWDRPGAGDWVPSGRPEVIKADCEQSLATLKVDCIDLFQLHTVDPEVPIEDSMGAIVELQAAGKVRLIGVSNVDADQLRRARAVAEVVSVQNRYSVGSRRSDNVLAVCAEAGIAFIPWFPLRAGELTQGSDLEKVAAAHDATPAQVALAWLLQRSPVMLPIPGTTSVAHLEENVAAAGIRLGDEEFDLLA